MNSPFLLDRTRAKVMGVAAGLADYTGLDLLAVRLIMIIALLITGPIAILAYFLTGWLASEGR